MDFKINLEWEIFATVAQNLEAIKEKIKYRQIN